MNSNHQSNGGENGLSKAFSSWMLANGFYIGACEEIGKKLPANMPNFKGTLDLAYKSLFSRFVDLNMKTEVGCSIPVIYPAADYAPSAYRLANENTNGKLSTYVSDLGITVIERSAIDLGSRNSDLPTAVLYATYEKAEFETYRLAKEALGSNDYLLRGLLLGENGYLAVLLYMHAVICISLRHIHFQNGLLFIPDEYRDESHEVTKLRLSAFDFDNPAQVPYIAELNFIFIDNADGAISPGTMNVGFQRGQAYSTNDTFIGDYLYALTNKIVKRIEL